MKKIIVIIFAFAYLSINAQGIEFFKGTFEEAKALSKKEGKLIFLDAYAAWCGPCKRMAKNVFPLKEAGDYFNKNFINLQVDMEKGEGRGLAKKYGVGSYPTLLFLNHTGEVVYKTKGARSDAKSLIALGEIALKPNKTTLKTYNKKWEEGNREETFLEEYVSIKSALDEDYEEVLSTYIDKISKEEKTNKQLEFIYKYTTIVSSVGMRALYENKSTLKNIYSKETFDSKIYSIAKTSIAKKDQKLLIEVKSMLKNLKPKDYKKKTLYYETKFYGTTKNWNAYDKAVSKYLKKYKKGDDVALRNTAWNYYMNIDDKQKLEKAEKWMVSAVKINNSYKNNLTQAYLLYKLKKYSLAQDAIEYALILAKDSTNDTKNAGYLKQKIEKGLEGELKPVEIEYEVK